jgi:hypothetical protein
LKPARTVLAVLLGYLALLAVEFLGAVLVRGLIALEAMTFLAGVAGGGVTARVAGTRPLLHAGVLAAVIIAVGSLAAEFSRHPLPPGVATWYPYAATLLTGAGTFVGGALAARPKNRA